MDHLSEWHAFDPSNEGTYPKVNAPVQVKYDTGKLDEGFSVEFFRPDGRRSGLLITGWRYIKQKGLP
jgi:hypothetical protein